MKIKMPNENEQVGHDETFNNYLLQEYACVAEAHFKTIETISTFFKHYLALMTIPIILIAYLLSTAEKNEKIIALIKDLKMPGGILLIVIALAGFAVMLYMVNLRLDAVLYARTINGIRKYFYDFAQLDINIKLRIRILPQTTSLPAYFEGRYFLPVIFSFSILDGFYLFFGSFIIRTPAYETFLRGLSCHLTPFVISSIASTTFFMLHYFSYQRYSAHRETGYLKSNIIGIDVDGVLNKHRDHFCKMINSLREGQEKDQLKPAQITHIPVHESGLTTWEEDSRVFNDPKYWVEMPLEDDSPKSMKKLRNIFNFKILIFTHRPWPNMLAFPDKEAENINSWQQTLLNYEEKVAQKIESDLNDSYKLRKKNIIRRIIFLWSKLRFWYSYKFKSLYACYRRKKNIINRITFLWLKYYGIEYDDLKVEKGNEDVADPRGHFRNRFQLSRKKRIKFFVEDDLEKATKLAFICDVVFLFAHPYNHPPE